MRQINSPNDIKPGILLKNGKSGYYSLVLEVVMGNQEEWFNCVKIMFFGDDGYEFFESNIEELDHHNWAICNRKNEMVTIRNIPNRESIDNLITSDNFNIESPF